MNNHQSCIVTLQCFKVNEHCTEQTSSLASSSWFFCVNKAWNSQELEAQGWKMQLSETIFICRGVIICLAHVLSTSYLCSACHWETCGNTAFSGKVGPTPVSLFLWWWNLLWNFCPQNASPVGSVEWCLCRRALIKQFNQGTQGPAMH